MNNVIKFYPLGMCIDTFAIADMLESRYRGLSKALENEEEKQKALKWLKARKPKDEVERIVFIGGAIQYIEDITEDNIECWNWLKKYPTIMARAKEEVKLMNEKIEKEIEQELEKEEQE